MKQKTIFAVAVVWSLATAALAAQAADIETGLLGETVPLASITPTTRVVVLNPETSYVNVTHGDVVEFMVDNKSFAWEFDGNRAVDEIDLAKIAPAGLVNHPVRVYIARNKHVDYGA